MNKKIVAIVLVIALALTTAFAASTKGTSRKDAFSVGAGVGTGLEVVAKYGKGDFDFQGGLSLDFLSGSSFSVNAGAFYSFAKWNVLDGSLKAPQYIYFTTGPIARVSISNGLALGALWGVGAEYTFPKVPVTAFLKVGLGADIAFSDSGAAAKVTGLGVLGALYNF